MITRYYVRQMQDGNKYIGCYDVEHGTGRYDGYNALLKRTNTFSVVVEEILDSIVLDRECRSDVHYINNALLGNTSDS